MRFAAALTVLLLAISSAGCSVLGLDKVFRDRSDDYRRSAELPHIDIPEGFDSDSVGELYPIPEGGAVASYQTGAEFEVPRPRNVSINDSANEVKIQRLGEDSWILTSVSPGETWPLVRSFLSRQAIPTSRADAGLGVIETGWFSLSDDESILHQFLITLSQGVQLNTTEIEVVQRSYGVDEVPDDLSEWPTRSFDSEKEAWLRDGMASTLADENALGTASLLGRDIGAAQKVVVVTPENEGPYIDMRLGFQRAWASVGYALGTDGFSISDRSIDEKYYLAVYVDPIQEERTFFQRLRGAKKVEPVSYRVLLSQASEESVHVRVYDSEGNQMSQRESFLVLERIRSNLG